MNKTLSIELSPVTIRPVGALTGLGRALSAELLKMKRTLALWLTLIAPAAIAVLQFILILQRGQDLIPKDESIWVFLTRQELTLWALLMQPLFITLETALTAQLDHSSDHWKHLFALPLPRWTIYAAKWIINVGMIGISLAALYGLVLLSGLFFRTVRPELGFQQAIPLGDITTLFLVAFPSAWMVISVHNWISLRWRSFVVACAVGIVATIAGILIINTDFAGFYPWTTSAVVFFNYRIGDPYLPYLIYGGLGGILAAFLGGVEFVKRETV